MSWANVLGADVLGVDLSGADLSGADLSGAVCDGQGVVSLALFQAAPVIDCRNAEMSLISSRLTECAIG
ncbi:pentapeptide repeat-containing protein [Advenella kashmirensis]|uniref:pentapeptide repeat-containing protein n=1 Tax=Advenella kashmirensis TaxID=310575 RepID=UPI00209D743F